VLKENDDENKKEFRGEVAGADSTGFVEKAVAK
jgi:hypothetical protein